MPENYFEIENVSFAAGGKNKVNNVNLSICLLYTSPSPRD